MKNQRESWLRRTGNPQQERVRELTRQMRSLPSKDPRDPDYVRVRYLRYADDWIIGVTGPKALADQIRDEVRQFLKDRLKLDLSLEKTRITHAKSEEAHFLGVRLLIGHDQTSEPKIACQRRPGTRFYRRRSTGWSPILKAPTLKLVARLHQKGFCDANGWPTSQKRWFGLDADQIIRLYNGILRGLLNYYRFVDNFASLWRIQYILRFSLAKTLARKFQTSIRHLFQTHGRTLRFRWERPDGSTHVVEFDENADWRVDKDAFAVRPPDLDLLGWQTSLRTRSKLGYPCLICGATDNVDTHHVRHIRKAGTGKPKGFMRVMLALNRKQIPVCQPCHQKIHSGEYDGIGLKDLAYEFTARLK